MNQGVTGMKPQNHAGGPSMGKTALNAIFWSLVQNWGGRFSTFILFVFLTRFVGPSEYGVLQACLIITTMITLVSEFGFGDAIVQSRTATDKDVNLPFYFSLAMSCVLVVLCIALSSEIERLIGVPGVGNVLIVLAFTAPLTTISSFQEFCYRKQLAFKGLAIRILLANVIAGPIAVFVAYMNGGIWSLVTQSYLTIVVGLVWLWSRPLWWPTLTLDRDSFWTLLRFGLPVVSLRVIDFAAMKLVDIIILNRFGLVFLGIYAVGSRLYQVLMQLLQSALNDVSLAILSRIADDRERMAHIYIQAIMLASFVAAPAFALLAALSPEVCHVLFGTRWAGVEDIARPLLILGAVQCVQFINGPYLSARGRPGLVLKIALVKYVSIIIGLLAISRYELSPGAIVTAFALLQMVATPLTFFAISRELKLTLARIAKAVAPATVACILGYFAVSYLRGPVQELGLGAFLQGVILGFGFGLVYVAFVLVSARQHLASIFAFVRLRTARSK